MPNYDFHCTDCGHEYEEIVPLAERDEPRECPSCGKKKVKRGVSAVKLSYSGFQDPIKRAGAGWNDVLKGIKKASGKKGNTIRTA